MKYIENRKKVHIFIILLMLSAICCSVLFCKGVMEGHDTVFHIHRLESLAKAIANKQIPLYVAPEMLDGFGYGTSLFYCDFMLYFPALMVVFGMDLVIAYKIMLMGICIMVVFVSYYSAEEILKNDVSALFCTAAISLSCYFNTDMFLRGATGEAMAFIFVPITVAGIYNVSYGNEKKWWQLAIGFSGLLMTHNLSFLVMCILFFLFIIVFAADTFLRRKTNILKKRFISIFKAAVSAVAATAWFLLPMAEQLLTTEFMSSYHAKIYNPSLSAMRIRNLFVELTPSPVLAPSLGLLIFIFIMAWFVSIFAGKRTERELFLDMCGSGALFCIFGSTSVFPWAQMDPYLNIIQFPWRLHLFTTVFTALAGSYWITKLLSKIGKGKWINVIVAIFIIFQAYIYTGMAQEQYNLAVETDDFIDWSVEYRYYDENYLHINTNRNIFANRKQYAGKIRTLRYNLEGECVYGPYGYNTVTFKDNNYRENSLEMPIHYFYGYEVKDSETGKILKCYPSAGRGWLAVNINEYDDGIFTIVYRGTLLQKVARIISSMYIIFLCFYLMRKRYIKINNSKNRQG